MHFPHRILVRQPPSSLPGSWFAGAQAEAGPDLTQGAGEGVEAGGRSWRCPNPGGAPSFLRFRAATDLADRERAYGLGYRIYRTMGYTAAQETRTLVLPCDARPDTLALLATAPGARPAGTVSLWFDHFEGLPCEVLYPGEVAALRSAGGRLVEAGRFAIDDEYRHCILLVARLLNLIFLYACHARGSTHLLCTVNPRHVAFYLRKLRFRRLGPPRPCSRVGGALAELLALDLETYAREVRQAHARGAGSGMRPESSLYRIFLEPRLEQEAAAFLAQAQRPMSPEVAAYYRLRVR